MNDRGLVVTCVDLHGHGTRNICCSVVSLIIQTRTRAQIEIEAVPLLGAGAGVGVASATFN